MHSDDPAIEKYLEEVRKCIDNHQYHFEGGREKNIQSLIDCNLKLKDVYQHIYQLNKSNYISGPDSDRDFSETEPFWIFKMQVYECIFYIKIKIRVRDNRLNVVSFHIDDFF